MGFLRRLGAYILARAQERSSVGAVLGVAGMLLGITLPPGLDAVVAAVASVIAAVIAGTPGGK